MNTYFGVSNAEAADRFTTRVDDLMPGRGEAVCGTCNLVMPAATFAPAFTPDFEPPGLWFRTQCGDCQETRGRD